MSTDMKNYRIGVDVGDRSVGLAAIEFDDAGFPIQKLAWLLSAMTAVWTRRRTRPR